MDGVEGEVAEAGDAEEAFEEERAGVEVGEGEGDVGDDGAEGVFEDVDEEDAGGGEALGEGGADVVLVHFFEEEGAVEADVDADAGGGADEDGEEEGADGFIAPDGEPAELEGEDVLADDDPDEVVDGHEGDAEGDEGAVEPLAAAVGAEEGEGEGDGELDEEDGDGEGKGGADAFAEEGGDGAVEGGGAAEVEAGDAEEEIEELGVEEVAGAAGEGDGVEDEAGGGCGDGGGGVGGEEEIGGEGAAFGGASAEEEAPGGVGGEGEGVGDFEGGGGGEEEVAGFGGVPAGADGGGGGGEVDGVEGAGGGPVAEEEGLVVAAGGVEFGEGFGGGVLAEDEGGGGAADDVEEDECDEEDAEDGGDGLEEAAEEVADHRRASARKGAERRPPCKTGTEREARGTGRGFRRGDAMGGRGGRGASADEVAGEVEEVFPEVLGVGGLEEAVAVFFVLELGGEAGEELEVVGGGGGGDDHEEEDAGEFVGGGVEADAVLGDAEGEGDGAAFDAADVGEGDGIFHGGGDDGFALDGGGEEAVFVVDEAFGLEEGAEFLEDFVAGGALEVGNHEGFGGEAFEADGVAGDFADGVGGGVAVAVEEDAGAGGAGDGACEGFVLDFLGVGDGVDLVGEGDGEGHAAGGAEELAVALFEGDDGEGVAGDEAVELGEDGFGDGGGGFGDGVIDGGEVGAGLGGLLLVAGDVEFLELDEVVDDGMHGLFRGCMVCAHMTDVM